MHERLGKYELVRHLASGGMASVYLARLSGLGGFERHVVLKTLRTEGLADDTLVPMFLDEARLVARLHHQHIAQVYEVGRDAETYYLAMEYVHGETVRAVLETANKHGHRLPLEFGLTVVCAAAAGLHHAHERRGPGGAPLGIVHRDVTPSNVIVSYDGSIKLIDFGIAKANDRSIRTRSGLIKGKAGYMAPEQVKGYPVDRRSDVFALGVVAYELTTQSRAFQADTQFEQLERIAHGTIVPPSAIVPGYPLDLEDVVMRALEVDPDDRYADARVVRDELERVARSLGLGLTEDCVMDVLAELYGPRPEPWLVDPGSIDYDITPSIHELPFAIEVLEAPVTAPLATPVPARARATRPLSAVAGAARPDVPALRSFPRLGSERDAVAAPARASQSYDPTDVFEPLAPADEPDDAGEADAAGGASGASGDADPSGGDGLDLPPARPATTTALVVANRWPLPLACALAAVGGVVIGTLLFFLGNRGDEPIPPAPSPAAESTPTPVKAAAAPHSPDKLPERPMGAKNTPPAKPARVATAPDHVMLHVISDPPDSSVVLDGVRIGHTPFHGEVPAKTTAWLKVRRSDRMPVRIRVALDHDYTWTVKLPARR